MEARPLTELFATCARLDAQAVADAVPPSVRRDIDPAPMPRRDGADVLIECGPWIPRTSPRHVLPSLALLAPDPPSVRFEVSARRDATWSAWIATATLGDTVFPALPGAVDGLRAEIDEIHAAPGIDALRVRARVGGPRAAAALEAPWLLTCSASDGTVSVASRPREAAVRLGVPARTQMTEAEAIRARICSPTSVAMALQHLGRSVPTPTLAQQVFHAPTDRYGLWPAAVRAAGAHGVPGYLLRFVEWDAVRWCLENGLPIVASIRYGVGELRGAPMPETTGHLIVITGLDGDDVLVNDPAAPTADAVPRRYPRDELTRAWLDGTGVGYVFFRGA